MIENKSLFDLNIPLIKESVNKFNNDKFNIRVFRNDEIEIIFLGHIFLFRFLKNNYNYPTSSFLPVWGMITGSYGGIKTPVRVKFNNPWATYCKTVTFYAIDNKGFIAFGSSNSFFFVNEILDQNEIDKVFKQEYIKLPETISNFRHICQDKETGIVYCSTYSTFYSWSDLQFFKIDGNKITKYKINDLKYYYDGGTTYIELSDKDRNHTFYYPPYLRPNQNDIPKIDNTELTLGVDWDTFEKTVKQLNLIMLPEDYYTSKHIIK